MARPDDVLFHPQYNKVKDKVVPVHAKKAHRGRRGIGPLILHLGGGRSVVNTTPRMLYPLEKAPVPIK
jgi:hypothetical protein